MTRDLSSSEKQLRAHSGYIEVVLSNVSAGVISIDQKGFVTTFNKRASQLLGINPQLLLGRYYQEVLKAEHMAVMAEVFFDGERWKNAPSFGNKPNSKSRDLIER